MFFRRGSKNVSASNRRQIRDPNKITLEQFKLIGERELEKKRRRELKSLDLPEFSTTLKTNNINLTRRTVNTVYVNIGLYCNQACNHCHVESSPQRWEMMDDSTVKHLVNVLTKSPEVKVLDITGGAPELHSNFRYLVREARELGLQINDRCNLTVLFEPGQEDLVDFLVENKIQVIASLPCYSAGNVNKQRGSQVFEKSISALQLLNSKGYGIDPELKLNLVYNPLGASLPGNQKKLEEDYKRELLKNFNIKFNSLLCLANMPIKRFVDVLLAKGELEKYMNTLVKNFNPSVVSDVMCNDSICVNWSGHIYDCDFNNALDLPMVNNATNRQTIWDISSFEDLKQNKIQHDFHCYGCTAGSGSS